jgi:isoleucyl-tRNA synthetase
VLDLEVTPELVDEGRARDLVRVIQQARREAGLHVSDRIRAVVELPAGWRAAAERHKSWIAEQTLAVELRLDGAGTGARFESNLGGEPVRVGLERISPAA